MKSRLLEYLVCPSCQGELGLNVTERRPDGEIVSGALSCRPCRQSFQIIGGVPRMLAGALSAGSSETADCFGWQWQKFETVHGVYEEALFLDWVAPFSKQSFAGKVVLDAGCGTGRHAAFASRFGAKEVIAVDFSLAVDAAYGAVGELPNCHVIQADIFRLPLRSREKSDVDFIYSIGVLHHTPDPKQAFLALATHLRPGGVILAWVYGHEGNEIVHYLIDPARRLITSRLPRRALYALSWLIAVPLQLLVKGIYKPVNEKPTLRRLRTRLYYNEYFFHISRFTLRHNHNIVFDHLSAPTAFYIPFDQFRSWFDAAGMCDVGINSRNRNSWRGWGTKRSERAVLPGLAADSGAHTGRVP